MEDIKNTNINGELSTEDLTLEAKLEAYKHYAEVRYEDEAESEGSCISFLYCAIIAIAVMLVFIVAGSIYCEINFGVDRVLDPAVPAKVQELLGIRVGMTICLLTFAFMLVWKSKKWYKKYYTEFKAKNNGVEDYVIKWHKSFNNTKLAKRTKSVDNVDDNGR